MIFPYHISHHPMLKSVAYCLNVNCREVLHKHSSKLWENKQSGNKKNDNVNDTVVVDTEIN